MQGDVVSTLERYDSSSNSFSILDALKALRDSLIPTHTHHIKELKLLYDILLFPDPSIYSDDFKKLSIDDTFYQSAVEEKMSTIGYSLRVSGNYNGANALEILVGAFRKCETFRIPNNQEEDTICQLTEHDSILFVLFSLSKLNNYKSEDIKISSNTKKLLKKYGYEEERHPFEFKTYSSQNFILAPEKIGIEGNFLQKKMSHLPGMQTTPLLGYHFNNGKTPETLFGSIRHCDINRESKEIQGLKIRLSLPNLTDNEPPNLMKMFLSTEKEKKTESEKTISICSKKVSVTQEKPIATQEEAINATQEIPVEENDSKNVWRDLITGNTTNTSQYSYSRGWEDWAQKKSKNMKESFCSGNTLDPLVLNLKQTNMYDMEITKLLKHRYLPTEDILDETTVVQCMLWVCSGIPSDLYQWYTTDCCFKTLSLEKYRLHGGSSKSLFSVLEHLRITGTHFVRLRILSDYYAKEPKRGGKIVQALAVAIRIFLVSIEEKLTNLSTTMSILSTLEEIEDCRKSIAHVSQLFWCQSDELWRIEEENPQEVPCVVQEKIPLSVNMLNYLYEHLITSPPSSTSPIIFWFLHQASSPYLAMVSQWLYTGYLTSHDDPFNEFILVNDSTTAKDVISILCPSFFTLESQNCLLRCGKTLQCIREVSYPLYRSCTISVCQPLYFFFESHSMEEDVQKHSFLMDRQEKVLCDYMDEWKTQHLAECKQKQDTHLARVNERIQELEMAKSLDNEAVVERIEMKKKQMQLIQTDIAEKSWFQTNLRKLEENAALVREKRQQEMDQQNTVRHQEAKRILLEKYAKLMQTTEYRAMTISWRQRRCKRITISRSMLRGLHEKEMAMWLKEKEKIKNDHLIHCLDEEDNNDSLENIIVEKKDEEKENPETTEQGDVSDMNEMSVGMRMSGESTGSSRIAKNNSSLTGVVLENTFQEKEANNLQGREISKNEDISCESTTTNFVVSKQPTSNLSSIQFGEVRINSDPVVPCQSISVSCDEDTLKTRKENLQSRQELFLIPNTIRITSEPGGSGEELKKVLYGGGKDEENMKNSVPSVRILSEPGGSGEESKRILYGDEENMKNSVPSVRILSEPGGSGEESKRILYGDEENMKKSVPSVRISSEPGGSGEESKRILYGDGKDDAHHDVPSVRILSEPGGSGEELKRILYGDGGKIKSVSSVRISSEPGGSGERIRDLIYGDVEEVDDVVDVEDAEDVEDVENAESSSNRGTEEVKKRLDDNNGLQVSSSNEGENLLVDKDASSLANDTLIRTESNTTTTTVSSFEKKTPSDENDQQKCIAPKADQKGLSSELNEGYVSSPEYVSNSSSVSNVTSLQVNSSKATSLVEGVDSGRVVSSVKNTLTFDKLCKVTTLAPEKIWNHSFLSQQGIFYEKSSLPLGIVVEKCIHLPISRMSQIVDKAALHLFLEQLDLMEQLSLMKRYLHHGPSILNKSKMIKPDYSIAWPYEAVVSKESVQLYKEVLNFLEKLRDTKEGITKCSWDINKQARRHDGSGLEIKRRRFVCLFTFMQQCVMDGLHSYIITQIESCWIYFLKQIDSVSNIQCLKDLHDKYMNMIIERLFLSSNEEDMKELLTSIMSVTLQFHGTFESKSCNLEERLTNDFDKILALHKDFLTSLMKLLEIRNLVQEGSNSFLRQAHLQDLCLHLDFNGFLFKDYEMSEESLIRQ